MNNPIKTSWEEFLKSVDIKSCVKTAYKELNVRILADTFPELENLEISVKKIFLNPKTYSTVRKWGRDLFDVETDREKIEEGICGYIWGASFIVSTTVPDSTVLIISEHEDEGVLLKLNEDIPGSGELIEMHDRLQQMSSEIQSLMYKVTNLIQKTVTAFEKIQK